VHGFDQVSKAIEFAATQFREGKVTFDSLAKVVTQEMAYIVEVERYRSKLVKVKTSAWTFFVLRASFDVKMGVGSLLIATGTQQQL
jgi:hypothetical protein